MADLPISGLQPYTNPDPINDSLVIVNAANQTTQKISINALLGITSATVGVTDTQTLVNKTLTASTITSPVITGTITGTYTLGGTPTFPAAVVTLTGTQSLTNKTLVGAALTAPTLSNATISADAITGYTTANSGTIYGVAITNGAFGPNALGTNSVQANQLSTTALTLAYNQIVSTFSAAVQTGSQTITGLSSAITIPAGGRKVKITVWVNSINNTSGTPTAYNLMIFDQTTSTVLSSSRANCPSSFSIFLETVAVVTPSAGSKTYTAQLSMDAAVSTNIVASTTAPAFILVEVI